MKAELKRPKIVTLRFSEAELKEIDESAKRARNGLGTTRSNYIRAQALRRDIERAEAIWALRNTVRDVAPLVKASPRGMDALIRAMDNISRAKL